MNPFNLGSLFGDKDLSNMLGRVDTLVDSLSKQRRSNKSDKDISDAALREVLSSLENNESSDESEGSYEQLLEKLSISAVRLSRYKIYDEIYGSVQLIKRIVQVYINNCLQKDVLTGKAINIKETDQMKDDNTSVEYYKHFIENSIDHFKLETQLNDVILNNVLRYGDHYIEIIDLKDPSVSLPVSKKANVITENSLRDIEARLDGSGYNETTKPGILEDGINKLYNYFVEVTNTIDKDTDYRIGKTILEADDKSTSDKSKNTKSKTNVFDIKQLNRIILRYHKPHNIVVITTDYGSIIGYVEIKENIRTETTAGIGSRFATMINQLSSMSGSNDNSVIIQRIINKIINDVIKKLDIAPPIDSNKSQNEINKQYEELLYNKLGDELFYMLKKLFIETNPKTNKMKKLSVRFISKDRIVRISHNPVEYFPYGTSILDPLVYPGKLYLLTQLTNVVSKLSRAALIRKWTINNMVALYSDVY